jgi:DNA/RNA-binding domain of Phe-tRNA-synthetase-like protein
MFTISDNWLSTHPRAHVGVMIIANVNILSSAPSLDTAKQELEQTLQATYAQQTRKQLLEDPILSAYASYYERFNKTYHVLLQLESIISGERHIPSATPLVATMFMAELKNRLLTAVHDVALISQPLVLNVATGDESYTLLNSKEQQAKTGDMLIRDTKGVISSIVYGPDQRTSVTSATEKALFVVYAPDGITTQAISEHLADIEKYIHLFAPAATIETKRILPD